MSPSIQGKIPAPPPPARRIALLGQRFGSGHLPPHHSPPTQSSLDSMLLEQSRRTGFSLFLGGRRRSHLPSVASSRENGDSSVNLLIETSSVTSSDDREHSSTPSQTSAITPTEWSFEPAVAPVPTAKPHHLLSFAKFKKPGLSRSLLSDALGHLADSCLHRYAALYSQVRRLSNS